MFWPAVIGSSGLRIAMFADTIMGSLLQHRRHGVDLLVERLYRLRLVWSAWRQALCCCRSSAAALRGKTGKEPSRRKPYAGHDPRLTAPFVVAFMASPT